MFEENKTKGKRTARQSFLAGTIVYLGQVVRKAVRNKNRPVWKERNDSSKLAYIETGFISHGKGL